MSRPLPPLALASRRLTSRRPAAAKVPSLVLVLDRRIADPLAAVAALPRGAGVLVRASDPIELARLGEAVAPLCRRHGLCLLVSGDWRLAGRLGAAGLHLPETMAGNGRQAPALLWRCRTGGLLTVAAHSPAALARARRLGADAAFLSPLFPTRSHPGAPALGPLRFRLWAQRAGLPVLALGGVSPHTARQALSCGAAGLAAVDGLVPTGA